MKEIINLHIGQAGTQIGLACWQLFAKEHGITLEGKLEKDLQYEPSSRLLFHQKSKGQYSPRAVFIDLDPQNINRIKKGGMKNILEESQLVAGQEDAANNYQRGYQTLGKQMIDYTMDCIRLETEKCDNLEGFFIYNSIGGGTGSGFGTLLQQNLGLSFQKAAKIGLKVISSQNYVSSLVEPYNSLLAIGNLIGNQDLTICINNEALYDICKEKLLIQHPSYRHANQVFASFVSEMVNPMRYGGNLNTDMKELATNLVPFARMHFAIPAYSPFYPQPRLYTEKFSVERLVKDVFSPSHQLLKCDPQKNKYLASSILFSGDVEPTEVNKEIQSIKKDRFPEWCPTGVKVGLSSRNHTKTYQQGRLRRASCMLSNNKCFIKHLTLTNHRFDVLKCKMAFTHWYLSEGMEEMQFQQARENTSVLELNYDQLFTVPGADAQQEDSEDELPRRIRRRGQ